MSRDGTLSFTAEKSAYKKGEYTLIVEVRDDGTPQRTASAVVMVTVAGA